MKKQNLFPSIVSSSTIENCNEKRKKIKTYFILPFIELYSGHMHYYTAVHIQDAHRFCRTDKPIENILDDLINITNYGSLLYIKLVNGPAALKTSHNDKYICVEINILDFHSTSGL